MHVIMLTTTTKQKLGDRMISRSHPLCSDGRVLSTGKRSTTNKSTVRLVLPNLHKHSAPDFQLAFLRVYSSETKHDFVFLVFFFFKAAGHFTNSRSNSHTHALDHFKAPRVLLIIIIISATSSSTPCTSPHAPLLNDAFLS